MSAPGVVEQAADEGDAAPVPCRRFGVMDGMIAVAALAVGLAVARISLPHYGRILSGVPLDRRSGFSDWWKYLSHHPRVVGAVVLFTCAGLMVLLLVVSLTFVAMRLRRPRPPMGRVSLQPGMVAAEAMWVAVVAVLILDGLGLAPALVLLALALPVPAAWAALAWTGRWKPEPGWIDRFGRVLGVRWCLLVALYLAAVVVFDVLLAPP